MSVSAVNCDPAGEPDLVCGTGVEYSVERVEATIDDTWDFSDAERSRRRFLAIVAALSPGDAEALVWRTQVARTHSVRGEFEQRHPFSIRPVSGPRRKWTHGWWNACSPGASPTWLLRTSSHGHCPA